MEGSPDRRFFLEPEQTFHRRYEALRSVIVDDESIDRVAERFGYRLSAMRSMVSRFRADRRRGVMPPFSPRRSRTTSRAKRRWGPPGHRDPSSRRLSRAEP